MTDDYKEETMDESLNVYGEPLEPCSTDPLTGFYRDGCCNTSDLDGGMHTVCAVMTESFLQYTRFKGNDLSTPRPEFNFPGIKPGDQWCLCALRWLQAEKEGMAPKVRLRSTHIKTLEVVSLSHLERYGVDAADMINKETAEDL